MQEPYETLLGQYHSHPVIGRYIEDDVPVFEWLFHVLDMLSGEEKIMVRVAVALHTAESGATVAELIQLSNINLERVVQALDYFRTHRPS